MLSNNYLTLLILLLIKFYTISETLKGPISSGIYWYNFHKFWTNGHDVTLSCSFLKKTTVICLSPHWEYASNPFDSTSEFR